jgi:hypothetical protein
MTNNIDEAAKALHFAMVNLLKAYAAVQEHYGLKPEDSAVYRYAREANRQYVIASNAAANE